MIFLSKFICYGHINCDKLELKLCGVYYIFFGMFNVTESVTQMCVGMSCVSQLSDVLYKKHSDLKWMWLNIKVTNSILSSHWKAISNGSHGKHRMWCVVIWTGDNLSHYLLHLEIIESLLQIRVLSMNLIEM